MPRRLPIERRIAARVRSLREQHGMTQAELARLAATSRSQVAAIERGERAPTVTTVEVFARALGVPLVELLAEEQAAAPTQAEPDRADRLARRLRQRGPAFVSAVERVVAALDRLADDAQRRAASRRMPPGDATLSK